nr:hypothetical protein HmN_000086800 [Hymenolepis microstoma]
MGSNMMNCLFYGKHIRLDSDTQLPASGALSTELEVLIPSWLTRINNAAATTALAGSLHVYLLLLRELNLFNAPFHELLPYLKSTNPHLYYRFLSYFQNATSLSNLRMPLEKPTSSFIQLSRNIPSLAWSLPRRAPPLLHEDMTKKHLESKRESLTNMGDHETRPMTIGMLSEPPPPPIKSDSLPTISVTLMRSKRICDLPWYDKEIMGSEDQYILSDEVATSETNSERRVGICLEEEESRRRDLQGTFEIKRLSVEKMQYGIQPEKPYSGASKLPQFLMECSCGSVEEEELTSNSSDLTTVDAEVAASATSPSTTRRQWFKGLRSRLRRFFLCCNGTEED